MTFETTAILVLGALASVAPLHAATQTPGPPREPSAIREEIQQIMADRHIPALSVGVVVEGQIRMLEGFGTANLEAHASASAQTVYEIGSLTKPFTATAILTLVRAGKLGFDQELASVLPSLPQVWAGITIRQLLQHTSGIANFTDEDPIELFRTALSTEDVLARVAELPLNFEPGSAYSYSNTNYFLLGLVIEAVTGERYWDYLKSNIFEPTGMEHTGPTQPRMVVPWRAEGYRWQDGAYVNFDVIAPETVLAAGGLQSTVIDLMQWLQGIHAGTGLSRDDAALMWTRGKRTDGTLFGYGLGWNVADFFGHPAAFHEGATASFNSAVVYFPEAGVGVVVLANQYRARALSIAMTVASHYVEGILPSQLQARPELETTARQPLRQALLAMGNRDLSGPHLSPVFREALEGDMAFFLDGIDQAVDPSSDIELLWVDDVRPFRTVRFSERVAEVLYYRVTTDGSTNYLHVHVTADGRIADIDLSRG